MANYFYLTLDTTPPSSVSMVINGNATYTTSLVVNCDISTTDISTEGYQMKIWGSGIDDSHNENIKATEAESTWITYSSSQSIKLSSGDGSKAVSVKIRDDVYNESSTVTDTINLNTVIPTSNINTPDVTKVSKNTGKNTSSFTFTSDKVFTEYKVKVVSSTIVAESAGTVIGTLHGSVNMSGTGLFAANTPITCSIKGADLGAVSSGDAIKIIKVFVKDEAGLWSA